MNRQQIETLIEQRYKFIDDLKAEHEIELATKGYCICRFWEKRSEWACEIDRYLVEYRIATDWEIAVQKKHTFPNDPLTPIRFDENWLIGFRDKDAE